MRKGLRAVALALALLCLPAGGLAAYWPEGREIACAAQLPGCRLLQMVMQGSFDGYDPEDPVSGRVLSSVYPQLCAVTEDDFTHFLSEFGADGGEARENYDVALANCLWADIRVEALPAGSLSPARQVLLLFLDPDSQPDAEVQMARIRAEMTDEVLARIAGDVAAPEDFVRWLIEKDDWLTRKKDQ